MKFKVRNIFIIGLLFITCSDVIEFSPYATNTKKQNLNQFYIESLEDDLQVDDTLTFAILSDTHFYYDNLSKAIKSINNQKRITFVAVCGDITHTGHLREYEFFLKQMRKLHYPFITVIGNHDFLANGNKIYQKLFGDLNFTFEHGEYKFISYNSVIWENNNKLPDFEWINNEVITTGKKCILLSHIPIWNNDFSDEIRKKYYDITSHQQVVLSIHGHLHNFHDTIVNNKRSIVATTIKDNEYYLVHLFNDSMKLERVNF